MFVGLLFQAETQKVCLTGLAGAYTDRFSNVLADRFACGRSGSSGRPLGEKAFNFKPVPDRSMKVSDAMRYLKVTPGVYDQIWADAFNSDYMDDTHITTSEFCLSSGCPGPREYFVKKTSGFDTAICLELYMDTGHSEVASTDM